MDDFAPFCYQTPPQLKGVVQSTVPVAIVGAGPIGLAAAIDLAQQGIATVLFEATDRVSEGSRAICWAKRTLEIFDRLGVGQKMLDKGVTWRVGRLFNGDAEIYHFDLLPEAGYRMPAFVNLQQYYIEHYLVERALDFPDLIDLRWKNRVIDLQQHDDYVDISLECPDGQYNLSAQYLLACDGAHSTVRRGMDLELQGQKFEECFLIADVKMKADFPAERWFWFQPNFHSGQTALLHKQPDNIYRIDLQLGWDADVEFEKQPEQVIPRLKKALKGREFDLDWVSIYRFRCAKLQRFVHDRVIFAGDSAHVVSPFGARGGNGGIHDVDNLCWKLAAILRGEASNSLLESYNEERGLASQENITHSSRATNFMSPPNLAAQLFRDQLLALAHHHSFAQKMINSGRLSTPYHLQGTSLITETEHNLPIKAGAACPDLPLEDNTWLLHKLDGKFVLLSVGCPAPNTALTTICIPAVGDALKRYGKGLFLIRPDQHIAAVWTTVTTEQINIAHQRALGTV